MSLCVGLSSRRFLDFDEVLGVAVLLQILSQHMVFTARLYVSVRMSVCVCQCAYVSVHSRSKVEENEWVVVVLRRGIRMDNKWLDV